MLRAWLAVFCVLICNVYAEWKAVRPAPLDAAIRLNIALKTKDAFATLSQYAHNIANPLHVQYRRHLSATQLRELLVLDDSSVKTVLSWLESADVEDSDIHQQGNVLDVDMRIGQANTLLNTQYMVFTDGTEDVLRTKSYQIPADIRDLIDFVSPTDHFPSESELHPSPTIHPRQISVNITTNGTSSCGSDDDVIPECVRKVYDINYTPKPNRTTFAVYATEASIFKPDDLQKYLEAYNQPAAEAKATFQVIGSGDAANGEPGIASGFETALDTQTLLGLAYPANAILYDLGGVFGPNPGQTYDRFVQFLQAIMHNETVPSVVSFSESWSEWHFSVEYARSLCTMMMAIGARGTTLVFSSGNNGAQGNQPDTTHRDIFEPKFPASCPYVLSVGGTTDLADEKAATQSTITGASKAGFTASGGGFSNYFERPSYQSAAVQEYVASNIPETYFSKSGFCSTGRGIPDVSAFSTQFPTFYNGLNIPIGGTSAAAPTWAAIITLLNDYEASKGRPPLGFVNPFLYSLKDTALKDITGGGNNAGACQLLSNCTLPETPGYNVTKGWDAVTGLGSPIFSKLLAALDQQATTTRTSTGTSSNTTNPFSNFTCGTYQARNSSSTSRATHTHATTSPLLPLILLPTLYLLT